MAVLLLIVVGLVAGLAAGLLGIGGGIIIVPALAWWLSTQGVAPTVIMHMALGTSLASIVVTASVSASAHHRRGAVRWPLVQRLAPGIVVGALVGAGIADWLSGPALRALFGLLLCVMALHMAWGKTARGDRPLPGWPGMVGAGTGIGMLSSLAGIGGGTLTVPFLTWHGVAVRTAVGTAAAAGLPIGVAGAIAFMIYGWDETVPAGSLGYVHGPAFAAIVLGSIIAAPWGAALAHRISQLALKRVFALFMLGVGSYMLFK